MRRTELMSLIISMIYEALERLQSQRHSDRCNCATSRELINKLQNTGLWPRPTDLYPQRSFYDIVSFVNEIDIETRCLLRKKHLYDIKNLKRAVENIHDSLINQGLDIEACRRRAPLEPISVEDNGYVSPPSSDTEVTGTPQELSLQTKAVLRKSRKRAHSPALLSHTGHHMSLRSRGRARPS
jgi:hypothetical protein